MGRRQEAVYLAAAIPVRVVTSGTGVALALAAAVRLHDVAAAGLLIFLLNAPSVVAAPLIGALTDAVRSPKRFMAAAAAVMAAALAVGAFVGDVPLPVVAVALTAGGCVVPVFVGGLSAWVDEAMPGDRPRGFAVDALSYNVSSIAGPGIVAGIGVLLGPEAALLTLAAVMVAGGLLLQLLPIASRGGSAHPAALARGIAAAARHLATHGPLARVVAAGAIVQVGAGMMPIVTVLVATSRDLPASAGSLLVTAFAVGGITGALVVTLPAATRRLARIPARVAMAASFATTGALTLVAALVPAFPLVAIALALSGLPDAVGVASMLRLRAEESPAAVRAQVFVVASGLRVAAAAVGAALAGALSGLPAALLLGIVAAGWVAAAPILLLRTARGSADPR